MTNSRVVRITVVVAVLIMAACGKTRVDGLRDSFAQQLTSNRFVSDVQRSGEDFVFSGPTVEGGVAKWRIHIDSAVIEPGAEPGHPDKGVVRSSWYLDGKIIRPSGVDSNLPLELTSKGLAQDCWALWDKTAGRWGWE